MTAEREPWRAEAEAACMKSGAVKESATLVRISPIAGPGSCGAEFPLKVAALGSATMMSYSGDLRPPGAIPNGPSQPRWPINNQPNYSQPPQDYPAQREPSYPQQQSYPQQSYPQQGYPQQQPQGPMSLSPPGVAQPGDDEDAEARAPSNEELYQNSPRLGAPGGGYPQRDYPQQREPYPQRDAIPQEQQPLPRLGPSRGEHTASVGPITFKPTATLACPLVSQLDRWIMEAIQPAALKWFNQPVVEIRQISAYSCRGMNGNPNARISEHAFGNALDVAAFTLADGRRISVKDGWRGAPEEQGFLRDVQGGACQMFTTVLAPGSNVYHYDHIHVDLMRRSSGRIICQPAAVSGEVVAARAGGRYAGRDSGVTGSIAGKQRPTYRPTADDGIEDESNIRYNGN